MTDTVSTAASAVDFAPILDYFIYAALSAVSLGVAWGIRKLNTMLNLRIDDQMAERIRLGIHAGLRSAYERNRSRIAEVGVVNLKHALIADAGRYVLSHFPDATRHFKVETPDQLAEMVAARFGILEQPAAETPADPAIEARR